MRLIATVVCSSLLLLAVDALAADTVYAPVDTLRELKNAFARADRRAEWRTLSPGFKQRLSRRAGRNVDVADYIAARDAYSTDPRVKELEQWMPSAKMTHYHKLGGGRAKVTLRFGMPLFVGETADVTMINHRLWQLYVKGESQPFWGFWGDRSNQVFYDKDKQIYTVRTMNNGRVTWEQSWPAKDVASYRTFTKWFFDGFGQFEGEFMRGVGTSPGQAQPAARPRGR
jgi:hypothetical protein